MVTCLKRHVEQLGLETITMQCDLEISPNDVATRVAREIPNGTIREAAAWWRDVKHLLGHDDDMEEGD